MLFGCLCRLTRLIERKVLLLEAVVRVLVHRVTRLCVFWWYKLRRLLQPDRLLAQLHQLGRPEVGLLLRHELLLGH